MKGGDRTKEKMCTVLGIVGGFVLKQLGGWDALLSALVAFMAVDYLTGLMVAGVFHSSNKSVSGALSSSAGFRGLCKKACTLLYVLIAARLDLVLGSDYVRDAVVIGFMTNELLSVVENAGLMGLPLPQKMLDAVELLQKK